MQRDEVLRLALQCRERAPAGENDWITLSLDALVQFAARVEEATREACARPAARPGERPDTASPIRR